MRNPPIYISFNGAYHDVLRYVLDTEDCQVKNLYFQVDDPLAYGTANLHRKFNVEHAEHFFQWILKGTNTLDGWMQEHMPHTAHFIEEVEGRCTAYGPRIHNQMNGVIEELSINPGSRRAVILILEPFDQMLLQPKREGLTQAEYPCTVALHYWIEEDCLHTTTIMRSQNVYNVMDYDVYNFSRLLEELAKRMGIVVGNYHHFCIDAHVPRPFVNDALKAIGAA